MSKELTRRKLLRLGAGTTALGVVGSLSGCSAIQDLIPGQGSGLGSFSNWVYEPDAFRSDRESFGVSATNYKSVISTDTVDEDTKETITTREYPELGIRATDIEMELEVPDGRVITGSFDIDAVEAELTADQLSTPTDEFGSSGPVGSTEYESDGTFNDNYEIYVQSEPEESPNAFAVGNGTIVEGQRVDNSSNESDPVDASEVVEGILEAGIDGDDRVVDSQDEFSTLVDKLNNGVTVSAGTFSDPVGSEDGVEESIPQGLFEGVIASGSAESIDGDTTTIQSVFVYDSDGDVDEDDIEDWIEANDTGEEGSLSELYDINVSTGENTATVTGKIETYAWDLETF